MKRKVLNSIYHSTAKIFLLCITCLFIHNTVSAQEIEDLLYGEVDNIDPQVKPFVGFGFGTLSFLGDVRNTDPNPLNASLGYKVNLTTYIDRKHTYRGNFYLIGGSLTGNERNHNDLTRNLNFKSQIFVFGINVNYDFDHFYKKYNKLHPFVSIGFEMMTFETKVDSFTVINGEQIQYHYWDDGTIRDMPQGIFELNNQNANRIQRDYIYETDIREYDWGLGKYPQYGFNIPVEVGLDYQVSDRVLFRFGLSYHFGLSDEIDHVSGKNTSGVIGNNWNDDFMYTYFTLHLDLFSEDKTIAWNALAATLEDYDYTILFGDEDADGKEDAWDICMGTPYGVEVDTNGCPLDDDNDGVPNYQDAEPNSPYGVYVDENGIQITEDELAEKVSFQNAVNRMDVPLYIRRPESYANYKRASLVEIPQKFKSIDEDNDSYISYDEMMDAIDKFFDFESDYTSDEIYELNDFFFSQ